MSIYSYLLSCFPTICVALMVLSLWSTSHYWRTLSVSWLATLSVGHYYLHYDEDLTTGQLVWLCSLSVTLLMWSLLLTPFQLLLTAAEDRRPTAVSKVLWDPELFGVKKFAIKADTYWLEDLPEVWKVENNGQESPYMHANYRSAFGSQMPICLDRSVPRGFAPNFQLYHYIDSSEDLQILTVGSFIAVHGLGASSDKAWVHRDTGVHWLRDLLPSKHRDIRIITINHDSRWDAYSPVQSLRDYGNTILDAIDRLRRDEEEQNRPLILIGHSFGGILVKKAMVIAHERAPGTRHYKTASAAQAILFLGTPHQGSNYALFGTLASYLSYWRGSRTDLLEFLTPSSRELEDLHLSFLRAYENSYIVNFFETRPILFRGLPLYLVVAKESACMSGYLASALEADHRGLGRYCSLEDANFLIVVGKLEEALESISDMKTHQRITDEFTVPFRLRGAPFIGSFIGRDDVLLQMESSMLSAQSRRRRNIVILEGLGGIGKTSLAVEFATRNQSSYTAVFWVDGKSKVTIELGLATLAEQIKLKAVLEPNGKVAQNETSARAAIKAVCDWFELHGNTRWLLILDNIDSQIFNSPDQNPGLNRPYDLREYLPSAAHGTILLTTRLARLSQLGKGIVVGEMSVQDGIKLFCNASGTPESGPEVREIVYKLRGLPLAITQAGGYVSQTGISATRYLKQFDFHLDKLMGEENRLSYANGSMMSSWQISFDGVKSRSKVAANLLLFWGFLDNSDLWWGLFHLALKCENERCVARSLPVPDVPDNEGCSSNWLVDLAENESTFLEAIRILRDFSFVNQVNGSDGYAIHPVLHHWTRRQVSKIHMNSYLNTAAAVLGRASPLAHLPHAWLMFRRLTPHVDRFWHLIDQQSSFVVTAPDGFNGLGFFEYDRCNYVKAERAMEIAVEGWLQTVGLENPVGMQCYFDVALSWRVLGKYDKAEARMLEVLERCSIIEGPLAKTTLRSLDDLGRLYVLQEKYEKAAGYFLRAWKGKEQAWGPDNDFTLDTVRQLGLLYQKMGRLDEAYVLHRKVLAGFEKGLPGSKWIMLALGDLGMLHHRMGRLEEADLFLSKAFTTMRDQYGRDHSETEGIARNLAAVYRDRGLLDREKALLEKLEFDV